jgi:N-acetyl-gamma-glutamyl-phosphate reductase
MQGSCIVMRPMMHATPPSAASPLAGSAADLEDRPPVRAAILGATGYVGAELVRLLERHPGVRIVGLAARNRDHLPIGRTFPHLATTGHVIDDAIPAPDDVDVVFIALPHGQAASIAPGLVAHGLLVVDLGADFRLADAAEYREFYGLDHPAPDLLPGGPGRAGTGDTGPIPAAVYGLPELHRDALRTARLIASPGCYPTATLLALAPLARAGLIADVVVDALSGVSGAGRDPKPEFHFSEVNESVRAYGLAGHRHLPEIRGQLGRLGVAPGVGAGLVFTPHLIPMTRGMLATCHVTPPHAVQQDDLDRLYREAYGEEPFVDLAPESPATKTVLGSNLARVHAHLDVRSGRVLALSAIDNLVKGAAGQAVQAFNLAAGFPETTGLGQLPLYP